jgi:hypothetical protein
MIDRDHLMFNDIKKGFRRRRPFSLAENLDKPFWGLRHDDSVNLEEEFITFY